MCFAERFCPEYALTPPWVRWQHLTRYRWACRFARDQVVLDAACGTGYGSLLLRQAGATRVIGADLAPEAIAAATQRCRKLDRVEFHQGDVTSLPLSDGCCDLYVSFETIEHLADDQAFLREVRRVLRPGGLFVCSTPNRDLFDPGTTLADHPFSPYHTREYDFGEFQALLASFFPDVQWYGQSWYSPLYVRGLGALGRRARQLAVRVHQVRKLCGLPLEPVSAHVPQRLRRDLEPEIFLAVCR